METIFISIASYRDNQLDQTITDCLAKAAHPERLFFGVHWQHDNHEFFEQGYNSRVRVIETDYRQARGACWARSEAQKLYAGEDYVLQIDSHMRFAQGWDLICIDSLTQLQGLGNRKVLISNLMPSFDPDEDQILPQRYLTYKFGEFNPDGALQLKAFVVHHPPRERFSPGLSISAAFLFSIGDLYREVPIDPDLYFEGEEISYAVRAYTYGYDLYAAHFPIVYHYFLRKKERKHWDDHNDWGSRSLTAKARMRSLLGMTNEVPDLGRYGLSTVRSLEDYEQYAGVDFKRRLVNEPGETPYPAGERGIRVRLSRMKIGCVQIDPFSQCNARCWYCPVRYVPQPPQPEHIPVELFEKIIAGLCEERDAKGIVSARWNSLYTAHYNEVLLYRHLAGMFDILRRYKVTTIILTNGIVLTPSKVRLLQEYDDVVDGNVCINISAFERDRWIENTVAGNGMGLMAMRRMFYRTMNNIRYASQNLRNLSIQINEPDPAMADRQAGFAAEMFPGATVRKVGALSDRAGLLHDAGVISNRDAIDRLRSGRTGVVGCNNTFTGIDGRHFGWLHVNSQGKAILCCNDYRMEYTFGDLAKETLKDIWFSDRHIGVIERSFREICTKCNMAVWK